MKRIALLTLLQLALLILIADSSDNISLYFETIASFLLQYDLFKNF